MLSQVEQTRLIISRGTAAAKKSQFGQFFTPERTAAFMAGLFPDADGCCRLLDAGAGIGSLAAAFLERWRAGGFHFRRVELDAFEIDRQLHPHLSQTLQKYDRRGDFVARISGDDYIHAAAASLSEGLFSERRAGYTHAILNPPYKKINTGSAYRRALRRAGIETVNLYSAFVALAVAQAAPGGHIVAIVPRSFCNGPYYRPFRDFILQRAAIRHMHLFEARNKAFKDDDVLQENMIIRLERDAAQGPVTVSTSTDGSFSDVATHEQPFERIVFPNDPARFIHVPTSPEKSALELLPAVCHTLADLGITVSTGPVVDFRLKAHLRAMPEPGTMPLLYPGHFSGGAATWPIEGMKKPNAIVRNAQTERWLFPSGFYCVVRRFTAKEERRRVVASVVDPAVFPDAPVLGFENHLNLFHENRRGLPQALAHGLAAFLNTSAVDESFRRFNGHTQVNATDLKLMKYPSRAALIRLGRWAMQQTELTQTAMDAKIGPGKTITLSPGDHSELIRAVIEDFAPRFAPGSVLVYAGDTGEKWGYFDAPLLADLGVDVDSHGKMPDVVLYHAAKNWLLLVESVTSHGPVDAKRHAELAELFANATAGLVYVTAFPNRPAMSRYLGDIAWETEVWVADTPSHLIHFDGERFMGPFDAG